MFIFLNINTVLKNKSLKSLRLNQVNNFNKDFTCKVMHDKLFSICFIHLKNLNQNNNKKLQ